MTTLAVLLVGVLMTGVLLGLRHVWSPPSRGSSDLPIEVRPLTDTQRSTLLASLNQPRR